MDIQQQNFLKKIDQHNAELHRADKLIVEQYNQIQQLRKELSWWKKQATDITKCLADTARSERTLTQQVNAMLAGEEWKPEVQKIMQANILQVNLN